MKNRKLEFEIDRKNLEFEINRIKQESLFVYDLLISHYEILFDILPSRRIQINTNSKYIQRIINFSKQLPIFFKTLICDTLRQIIGETCLEKTVSFIFFVGILVAILISPRIPMMILVIMWLLLWLFRLCRDFIKRETSKEEKLELAHRFLKKNKWRAKNDLVIINELCSIAHISTLDFVLAEIKKLIDERQAEGEVYISFLPILSLVSVLSALLMVGDSHRFLVIFYFFVQL